MTRFPWHYTNLQGRITWRIRELHGQYGPVVRIAPDELSCPWAAAWRKIYGQRKPEFPKALDGRGIAPTSIGGRPSLMTETQENHLRLRRAINPAFSEKALREQEHYLQRHSSKLIDILGEKAKAGPVDMTTWYNLVAFDIVSGAYAASLFLLCCGAAMLTGGLCVQTWLSASPRISWKTPTSRGSR